MLSYNNVDSTVYISFSLACFLLLALLYVKRRLDNVIKTRFNRINGLFFATAGLILTDSAWCALELSGKRLPGLDFALIAAGYIIFLGVAHAWMMLSFRRVGLTEKVRVAGPFAAIPFSVMLLLLILSWRNRWIIDVREGVYARGPYFFLPFLLAALCYALSAIALLVKAYRTKEETSRRFYASLAVIPVMVIVTIGLQVFYAFNFCFLGMLLNLCVYDNEQILALWQKTQEEQKELDERMKVIGGLTSDFECFTYIRLGRTVEEDEMVPYCPNRTFSRVIPGWDEAGTYREKLDLIRRYVVAPDDKDRFYADTRRDVILCGVLTAPAYYVNFRAVVDGNVIPYQIKFTGIADENEDITALIAGIHRYDRRQTDRQK